MKNLVENAICKRVVFDNNRYSLKELFESFLVLSLQGDLLLDEKMEEIIFDEQKLCNGKVIFVHSCQDNVHNWNIFNLEIEDESDKVEQQTVLRFVYCKLGMLWKLPNLLSFFPLIYWVFFKFLHWK